MEHRGTQILVYNQLFLLNGFAEKGQSNYTIGPKWLFLLTDDHFTDI